MIKICNIVKVAEYADEAIYKEPNHPLILQNIICDKCSIVSDVDLFRSSMLTTNGVVCLNCN